MLHSEAGRVLSVRDTKGSGGYSGKIMKLKSVQRCFLRCSENTF